jgi:hypothetical protein
MKMRVIARERSESASFNLFELRRANLNGITGPERRPHTCTSDAKRSATVRAKCLDEQLAFLAVIGVYDNLRLKRHCA